MQQLKQTAPSALRDRTWLLARLELVEHGDGKHGACWRWTKAVNKKGYGAFGVTVNNTVVHQLAHRLSWILHYGDIPTGLCVLHKCDNPACCRPTHLFLGTVTDNNRDRHIKGRDATLRGEANGRSKLTEKAVLNLRRRWKEAPNKKKLAEEFGVSYVTAEKAVCGGWKHLTGDATNLKHARRGDLHHHAKLTACLVKEIRLLWHNSTSTHGLAAALSSKFCVSVYTIHDVVAYRSWKHVL